MIRCVALAVVVLAFSACEPPARRSGPLCLDGVLSDFGDVRVGSNARQTVTVSNPLSVPAEIVIVAPPAPFSVSTVGALRLAPGESRTLTVTFAPTAAGQVAGQEWSVQFMAGCEATTLPLTGFGFDATLTVEPGRLDFGELGSTGATRTAIVRNHTHSPTTLGMLEFSNPAFRSSLVLPAIIPALGSLAVEVDANGSGALEGVVTFITGSGVLSIPLLANRSTPCVTATPAEALAAELTCRSSDTLITLTNTCAHGVRLTSASISPGFAIVAGSVGGVLGAGESRQLALNFGPESLGSIAGALTLGVDVLDGTQQLTVPLAGEGLPMLLVQALVPVAARPLRDVLFVIDDSPGMLPLADSVRQNLGSFARRHEGSLEDLRVGVMSTSTAPADLARLRTTSTGASWLENPSSSELVALSTVQGASTARSSCLEVLHAAFSGQALTAFLRPHAFLQVICITNGVDQLETAPLPVISSLLSLMPRGFRRISVVARFAAAPGCGGAVDASALGAFADQADGQREEICAPNWSLGEVVTLGYRTLYYLQQRPAFHRAPLQVWVDGVELPADDSSWHYQGETNSISLQPLYAPAPGQALRLEYATDCP